MVFAFGDAVWIALIGGAISLLSLIVQSITAYRLKKISIEQEERSKATVIQVENVKTSLKDANEANNKKTDNLIKVTNTIHKLVNSDMLKKLDYIMQLTDIAAKRAGSTKEDIQAANTARDEYEKHKNSQEQVDEVQ